MERAPFRRVAGEQLATGIRVIDCLLPLHFGSHVALLADPGSFKSAVTGWIVRQSSADVNVLVLPDMRRREAQALIQSQLTLECLARTKVVTNEWRDDTTAVLQRGLSIARRLCQEGRNVLVLHELSSSSPARASSGAVDALLAAQREIASARGSLTSMIAAETCADGGNEFPCIGSESLGFDACIRLRHYLAERGYFPPIDVLESWSHSREELLPPPQARAAQLVCDLLRDYAAIEGLLDTAAYRQGRNRAGDLALQTRQSVLRFLQQSPQQATALDSAHRQLLELVENIAQVAELIDSAEDLPPIRLPRPAAVRAKAGGGCAGLAWLPRLVE